MRVGLLGTGTMGAPMARRLLLEDHDVHVWNRTLERTEGLRENGAQIEVSPAAVAQQTPILISMLSDATATVEVLLEGDAPPDLKDHIVIQMATLAPDENIFLARRIEDAGGEMLEAPVLGSVPQARRGELIVMASGAESRFHELREVLTAFGPQPRYLGPIGKASTLKLALNHLIAAETSAFSLSLGLVRRSGVDLGVFLDILRASALYAPTFDKKLDLMRRREFSKANFPAKHLLKDVRHIRRVCDIYGLNADLVEAMERLLRATVESGRGEEDYSVLYTQIDPQD